MEKSDYTIYRIPKKNGFREIAEPSPELKMEQRNILRWLISRGTQASKFSHGFTRDRSTRTNAGWHTGRAVVVRMDIKDFFPSINMRKVVKQLKSEGLDAQTADYIGLKCTLDGFLPQGAPTSPFLANLVSKDMDFRLAGLIKKKCKPYKAFYTRYADDMCFSSDFGKLNELIPAIIRIVSDEGFEINTDKTKIMRHNHRQVVAGVVVNEKPNISREQRRNFRAELHKVKMEIIKGNIPDDATVSRLQGMVGFVSGVSPYYGCKFRQDLREIERMMRAISMSHSAV
jgi:RNA-directed DNA polymerase